MSQDYKGQQLNAYRLHCQAVQPLVDALNSGIVPILGIRDRSGKLVQPGWPVLLGQADMPLLLGIALSAKQWQAILDTFARTIEHDPQDAEGEAKKP